jgi:heme-degrading monooxygenase HmoA
MVLETRTFRLVEGADEAAFLAADRRVQAHLSANRAGFLRRTTARADNGEWLVVTIWQTGADAEANAGDHTVDAEFDALIDRAADETKQYETLD